MSAATLRLLGCRARTIDLAIQQYNHITIQQNLAKAWREVQWSQQQMFLRKFSTTFTKNSSNNENTLDSVTYDRVCTKTLDALCDYFEELMENDSQLKGTDIAYGDGVLTVKLGQKYGTYVINRQTPNKQIWLSSPTSGPKRYDFIAAAKVKQAECGQWVYKHTGETLHQLLQKEVSAILEAENVDFTQLPYGSETT